MCACVRVCVIDWLSHLGGASLAASVTRGCCVGEKPRVTAVVVAAVVVVVLVVVVAAVMVIRMVMVREGNGDDNSGSDGDGGDNADAYCYDLFFRCRRVRFVCSR